MRIRKLCRARRDHSACGAMLSSFAAALVLGTLIALLFAFSIINCGVIGYYKDKLAFISQDAAMFAAGASPSHAQTLTAQHVAVVMTQMGLHSSALSVTVSPTTLGPANAVLCKIAVTLPLLAGSTLGPQIDLQDTSVASLGFAGLAKGGATISPIIVGNQNVVNANP